MRDAKRVHEEQSQRQDTPTTTAQDRRAADGGKIQVSSRGAHKNTFSDVRKECLGFVGWRKRRDGDRNDENGSKQQTTTAQEFTARPMGFAVAASVSRPIVPDRVLDAQTSIASSVLTVTPLARFPLRVLARPRSSSSAPAAFDRMSSSDSVDVEAMPVEGNIPVNARSTQPQTRANAPACPCPTACPPLCPCA